MRRRTTEPIPVAVLYSVERANMGFGVESRAQRKPGAAALLLLAGMLASPPTPVSGTVTVTEMYSRGDASCTGEPAYRLIHPVDTCVLVSSPAGDRCVR